jgi:hypothetical protein
MLLGGHGEDLYKHSAGENCASDISRLGAMVGMNPITPAAATYPVTSVGQTTMLAMYKKNECHQSVNVCV